MLYIHQIFEGKGSVCHCSSVLYDIDSIYSLYEPGTQAVVTNRDDMYMAIRARA